MDESIVGNWGTPDSLKDLNLRYSFEDVSQDSMQFKLKNEENVEIFYMDFFIRTRESRAFSNNSFGKHVVLQAIKTETSYRKMGIATFFITKLCGYCEEIGIQTIVVTVAPSGRDEDNKLKTEELVDFYKSFTTDEVKIVIDGII